MASTSAPPKQSVNEWVDAVYVLTVKSFDARIRHIQAQMRTHRIRFHFVFEHDAAEMDPAQTAEVFGSGPALTPAQQSLVLKNVQVWRDAVARDYDRVLVFEDDAVLADDFVPRFNEAMVAATQLPPGWLVFLGGLDTKVPDHYFRHRGPLVELPIATAEGCVYDRLAMSRRLEWLTRNQVTLPADHLMRYVDSDLKIRHFWLRHPIVEQGSVVGLFRSTLDANRQKHSTAFNILRNRWNKFQRRRLREWMVRLKAMASPLA